MTDSNSLSERLRPIARPVAAPPAQGWSPTFAHWVRSSDQAASLAAIVLLADRIVCGRHNPLFRAAMNSEVLIENCNNLGAALLGMGLDPSVPGTHPRTAGQGRPAIHETVLMLAARLVDPPLRIQDSDHNDLLHCLSYPCGIAEYSHTNCNAINAFVTLGTLAYLGITWAPLDESPVASTHTMDEHQFRMLVDVSARLVFARASWAVHDRQSITVETRELRRAEDALERVTATAGISPWSPPANLDYGQRRILTLAMRHVSRATVHAWDNHPFL